MLRLVDVHTYYGESHVLQGISLEVDQGTVVTLLGRNGMGKTTTVHSIIGFTPPRRGNIFLKGRDIIRLPPYRAANLGIALIPQGRRIFPSLNVKENLTIAARAGAGEGWTLDRVYSLFPVLKNRAGAKGTLLSGGEQQMLCIARALMTNPELLLMDEPSEGLAPLIVRELGDSIKDLHANGHTILLVEQNIRLALKVASYAYFISRGQVVFHCTIEELKKNREIQTEHLGVAEGKGL